MAFAPPFQRPFSATFDRRAAVAAGNGLLNALIAYWPGNEASGNLLDAHTNALHLTDTNTVTNAAGKVYATARQYTAANSEYHTRNSEALLQTGDVDFTIAAWVYPISLSTFQDYVAKWDSATANRAFILGFSSTANRFRFLISTPAANTITVLADNLGAPSVEQWYFLQCWHDPVANTINIQVNGGAVNSTPVSAGMNTDTYQLDIGALPNVPRYSTCRIGPVAMWKSAAGGGGVLSSSQRTALFNAGNGLAYTAFTT